MERRKRGDKHPTKNRIFWSYSHREGGREMWLSPEAFERKKQYQINRRSTNESKQYYKAYYSKNKQYYKDNPRKGRHKTTGLESTLRCLLSDAKSRAKNRNNTITIDVHFLNELWIKQNGKCFYTQLPMTFETGKTPFKVSIDRRNINKGYTKENTVLCCLSTNYCKHNFTEDQLNKYLQAFKLIKTA